MSDGGKLGRWDVSRETYDRLEHLAALVRKWNPAINLVSKATLDELWTRHILDSAQLYFLAGERSGRWVDLGSGGGFPGLVVAILAAGEDAALDVTLVESDGRKAAFLATAARELGVKAKISSDRIEAIAPLQADILSARALAPLGQLLAYADRHLAPDGRAILPKGANHEEELSIARQEWDFHYEMLDSVTDEKARIFAIRGISRV